MTWYHPKYYKELRKRNKSDQAISSGDVITGDSTEAGRRASDPGLNHQASSNKRQASSLTEPGPGDSNRIIKEKLC